MNCISKKPELEKQARRIQAEGGLQKAALGILFLESKFVMGGAEVITHQIARCLDRGRFRPVFCTLYEAGEVGEWFIRDRYPFYQRLIGYRYDPRAYWKLRRILKQENIGIIYLINQPLTIFWGLIMGKMQGIPVISVVHNTFFAGADPKLHFTRALMNRMDAVVAVAQIQKEHLVRNEGVSESLVRVIHNGIDPDRFQPRVSREEQRHSLGLDPGSRVVGVVARLVGLKGVDLFLSAAGSVLREFPNTRFLIVGDGPEAETLRSLARGLGLDSKVLFLGNRNDIPDLIQVLDVAVLCSRTEAFPVVILEYMAAGLPIVATNVGSVAEILQHEVTGLLVDRENPTQLASAISRLFSEPELARRCAESARALVMRHFTIRQTVRDTESLMTELLRRKRSQRRVGHGVS